MPRRNKPTGPKKPRRRSGAAKALEEPLFRQRVVAVKKKRYLDDLELKEAFDNAELDK